MDSASIAVPGVWRQLGALALAAGLVFAAAITTPALARAEGGSNPGETYVLLTTARNDLGTYLVGPDGMTLYYSTGDIYAGVSDCHGPCAELWPPLIVKDGYEMLGVGRATGAIGIVARPDGTSMATYRGRPLYYSARDEAPGDKNGHGLGNAWFVALVDGSSPPAPPSVTLESTTSELGDFLTDNKGMTLYFFAADTTPGVSACSEGCLEAWPPLTARGRGDVRAGGGATGAVGIMPGNGEVRITYDGRPLYYYAGDRAAGETNGHGVNDVWYVAAVDGSIPTE